MNLWENHSCKNRVVALSRLNTCPLQIILLGILNFAYNNVGYLTHVVGSFNCVFEHIT